MSHEHHLYQAYPANPRSVERAIDAAGKDPQDGWSQWVWVRLVNGDLVLGLFPCGDTYFNEEEAVDNDYVTAEHKGNVPGGLNTTTVDFDEYDV